MTSVVRLKRRLITAAILPVMLAAAATGLLVSRCSVTKPVELVRTIASITTVTVVQPTPPPAVIVLENHGALDSDTAFKFIRSVVQVRTGEGGGSGVILRSVQGKDKTWRTYILTAAHIVHDETEVSVIDFAYQHQLIVAMTTHVTAKVVEVSKPLDVALLEVDGSYDWGRTTELVRMDTLDGICLHDPVYAVGCPALEPPSITDGSLVGLTRMMVRISAPVAGGNSGGPMLLQDGRMIGMVGGTRVIDTPFGPTIVFHMALGTAAPPIALWLKCIGAGFLVGEKDKTVESFEQKKHPTVKAK